MKIGDKVKITDLGGTYSTYDQLFKKFNFKNQTENDSEQSDMDLEFEIFEIQKTFGEGGFDILAVRSGERELLIEESCVELVHKSALESVLNNISSKDQYLTNFNMSMSAKLADVIEIKGISTDQFATEIGTTVDTVEYWLSGTCEWSLALIFDISFALGMTAADFINYEIKTEWNTITETNKPEEGIEMLFFNEKWINEDFNPRGYRIGFLGGDGYITAHWWDYQDTYMTISKMDCEGEGFSDEIKNSIEPTHWKELGNSRPI